MQNKSAPNHLVCPVSSQIFLNPVIVIPSGQTFEEDIVKRIMNETQQCPITRQHITQFIQNRAMKDAVTEYLKDNPDMESEQYKKANHVLSPQAAVHAQPLFAAYVAPSLRAPAPVVQFFVPRHPVEAPQVRAPMISMDLELKRQSLLSEIQDLIFALKFEKGPGRDKKRNPIQNDSLMIFALFLQEYGPPKPWENIKVADGPQNHAMYQVLRAAKQALQELNPEGLIQAKTEHKTQYDLVKTVLGGQQSVSHGWGAFAKKMGTTSGQPGYLVNQMLERVESLLEELRLEQNMAHQARP